MKALKIIFGRQPFLLTLSLYFLEGNPLRVPKTTIPPVSVVFITLSETLFRQALFVTTGGVFLFEFEERNVRGEKQYHPLLSTIATTTISFSYDKTTTKIVKSTALRLALSDIPTGCFRVIYC